VPRLGELYPGICLTTEEEARKNLRQGSGIVPVVTMNNSFLNCIPFSYIFFSTNELVGGLAFDALLNNKIYIV